MPIAFPPLAAFADEHVELARLLRSHQAALIALDLPRARERLDAFSALLAGHMQVEEEILLPLFEERVVQAERWNADMVRRDHRKIERVVREIGRGFAALERRAGVVHEDVLDLLERELHLKHVLEHHDDRERAGLFRGLDEALAREDLEDLWERVPASRQSLSPGRE